MMGSFLHQFLIIFVPNEPWHFLYSYFDENYAKASTKLMSNLPYFRGSCSICYPFDDTSLNNVELVWIDLISDYCDHFAT